MRGRIIDQKYIIIFYYAWWDQFPSENFEVLRFIPEKLKKKEKKKWGYFGFPSVILILELGSF